MNREEIAQKLELLSTQFGCESRFDFERDAAHTCLQGAQTIRELLEIIETLETAAEAEAQKYERYVYGDD